MYQVSDTIEYFYNFFFLQRCSKYLHGDSRFFKFLFVMRRVGEVFLFNCNNIWHGI